MRHFHDWQVREDANGRPYALCVAKPECTEIRHVWEAGFPRRPVGPCPCECNRGGFCGGCGHAGCSGGINLR